MSLVRWLFGGRRREKPSREPKITGLQGREPVHSFDTELSGVELENPDGSLRQEIIERLEPGTETILMNEAGALRLVAVFIGATGECIGYLPRAVALKIIEEAKGYDYRTFVAEVLDPVDDKRGTGIRGVRLGIEVFEKG